MKSGVMFFKPTLTSQTATIRTEPLVIHLYKGSKRILKDNHSPRSSFSWALLSLGGVADQRG